MMNIELSVAASISFFCRHKRTNEMAKMEIILNGDEIKSESDLHRLLAEKLGFGPYYGANLAALWDRLTTDVERPVRLIWTNAHLSKTAMGDSLFAKIVSLFRDVEKQDRDFERHESFLFIIQG